MTVAHIGLGVFVLGITFVQSNSIERDVALKPGQSAQIGDYQLSLSRAARTSSGPTTRAFAARSASRATAAPVTVLHPEKRHYWVQGTVQTTAAIAAGLQRDLLAALGDDVGGGAWSLRFQYRPLIRLVWLGAVIMALGGVIAVIGRRQRGCRQSSPLAASAAARLGDAPRAPEAAACARGRAGQRLNRYLLPLAGFALLLVVLIVGLVHAPEKGIIPSPLIGKTAPQFSAAEPVCRQEPVSTSSSRATGRWSTSGAPGASTCRAEHPTLLKIKQQARVPIIGIDWNDDDADAHGLARPARQSLRAQVGDGSRRPRRDRLGRVRGAGELPDQPAAARWSTSRSAR